MYCTHEETAQAHTLGTRSRPWMSPLPASSQVSGVHSAQAACAQRPPAQRLSTPPSRGHSAHAGGRVGPVVACTQRTLGPVHSQGRWSKHLQQLI